MPTNGVLTGSSDVNSESLPTCLVYTSSKSIRSDLTHRKLLENYLLVGEQLKVNGNEDAKDFEAEWTVTNKYFTCPVNVVVRSISSGGISYTVPPTRVSDVQALLLVHFTAGRPESVSKWRELKSISAEYGDDASTKILVVDDLCSNQDAREEIKEFCLQENIELIELDEEMDDGLLEADEMADLVKAHSKEIVNTLHTTPWSNVSSGNGKGSTIDVERINGAEALLSMSSDRLNGAEALLAMSSSSTTSTGTAQNQKKESSKDEEAEMENFEKLFAQFAHIKETSKTFRNDDERKAFAEQVAMSFCKALTKTELDESSGDLGSSDEEEIDVVGDKPGGGKVPANGNHN